MPEQPVNPAQALGGAYPKPTEQPTQNAEVETLKRTVETLTSQLKQLENDNKNLTDKVKNAETENVRRLAEQVAELKVSRKMLTKEKKDEETSKLTKLSAETLKVLSEELSAVPVTLSADTPRPLAPPVAAPAPISEAQKLEQDTKAMRMQLFGHENPADEFYQHEREIQLSKRSW
jgi:outer membrane murein-binding lipoprotein Lpp